MKALLFASLLDFVAPPRPSRHLPADSFQIPSFHALVASAGLERAVVGLIIDLYLGLLAALAFVGPSSLLAPREWFCWAPHSVGNAGSVRVLQSAGRPRPPGQNLEIGWVPGQRQIWARWSELVCQTCEGLVALHTPVATSLCYWPTHP